MRSAWARNLARWGKLAPGYSVELQWSDRQEQVDVIEWQMSGQSRHCYRFGGTTCLCLKMHPVCMYADGNLREDHLLHEYDSRLSRHLPRFCGRFLLPVLDCRRETLLADVLVLEMVGPTLQSVLESLDAQSDPGLSGECVQEIFMQVLYAFEKLRGHGLRVLHVGWADI